MHQLSHPRPLWPPRLYYPYPLKYSQMPPPYLIAPYERYNRSTSPSDSETEDQSPQPSHQPLLTFLSHLTDHLNPPSPPSHFVSTFTTPLAARRSLGPAGGAIYKLDTSKFPSDLRLYSVDNLVELFLLPRDAAGKEEFLIHTIIPYTGIRQDDWRHVGPVVGMADVGKRAPADFEPANFNIPALAPCAPKMHIVEDLDDEEVRVRGEILRAAEGGDATERVVLVDERRGGGRRFSVPVVVLRHCAGTGIDQEMGRLRIA